MRTLVPRRRLLLAGAILASAFLFACSGAEERSGHETTSLAAPPVAQRSGPPSAEPAPAAAAQAAPVPWDAVTGPELKVEPSIPAGETAEPEESDRTPAPARQDVDSGPRVFSNEDLARYRSVVRDFGFEEGTVVVDVTKAGQSREIRVTNDSSGQTPGEREREVQDLQQRIQRLSDELNYLQGRIPSLHNPFLPRAALAEDDKVAEAGMDNAQRLDSVQRRIAETRQELDGLQRRMAELIQAARREQEPDSRQP